jgi:hypothetical protein
MEMMPRPVRRIEKGKNGDGKQDTGDRKKGNGKKGDRRQQMNYKVFFMD